MEAHTWEFIPQVDQVRNDFPGVVALDDVELRIRPGSVHAAMNRMTWEPFDALNIPPDPRLQVGSLTFAQKQMIEIAKAASCNSDMLITEEPTHGIDVGAQAEIDRLITRLAGQGAIRMISSERPQVLGMSDRIMVMILQVSAIGSMASWHLRVS